MFIVVLGAGVDKRGNLSLESKNRLKEAKEIHKESGHPLLLSGKYSFLYEGKDLPLKTQAEAMRDSLLKSGIKEDNIFLENHSQDTVFSAYNVKKDYFITNKKSEGFIVTSDFHLTRIEYIFLKVFGEDYSLKFVAVPSSLPCNLKGKIRARQEELTKEAVLLLDDIEDGDHEAVKEKMLSSDYYKRKKLTWKNDFNSSGGGAKKCA